VSGPDRRWRTLDGAPTRVIAHRGASGHRPEHTLEGYRLAIAFGADVIEPDLVLTRDGVLVARHDRGLARSTDIASRPRFAARARIAADGSRDWYVEDFDWPELAQVRAIQPFPGRPADFDGVHGIPTFAQVMALAIEEGSRLGRAIGVYPELKEPTEIARGGGDITQAFIDAVAAAQWHRGAAASRAPIWVQCFEQAPLARVRASLGLPTFELYGADDLEGRDLTAASQDRGGSAPTGFGLEKRALFDAARGSTGLLEHLHACGYAVHAWTFRDDRLGPGYPDRDVEYRDAYALGIDALFSDFPDSALAARARHQDCAND